MYTYVLECSIPTKEFQGVAHKSKKFNFLGNVQYCTYCTRKTAKYDTEAAHKGEDLGTI